MGPWHASAQGLEPLVEMALPGPLFSYVSPFPSEDDEEEEAPLSTWDQAFHPDDDDEQTCQTITTNIVSRFSKRHNVTLVLHGQPGMQMHDPLSHRLALSRPGPQLDPCSDPEEGWDRTH